ncbi:MAG: hypothetical protein AAGE94_15990 [Acidobacteriota bacterium]
MILHPKVDTNGSHAWSSAAMILAGLLLGSATIDAADDKPEPSSRYQLFGSLNLGYGETDGPKYRGVRQDGTADLRNAAIQLRYSASPSDELVVQLAHERVGTSPTNAFRDDIEVDWAFWGHTFDDGTSLRIGRVPLPIGFYNEIKDIGTSLPFYRASGNFYGEGTWTSDSVDGIVVSRELGDLRGWAVSGDLYAGRWERIETDGGTLSFGEADIRDALGFFVWFDAPSGRFRVGVGANRFEAEGGVFLAPGATDDETTRYLAIEGGGDRWTTRFEISRREFTGGYWQPFYLETVIRPNDRWQLAALYDVGHLRFEVPSFATFDDRIEETFGLAIGYRWTPDLVLKLEHHWVDSYGQIEDRAINIFFDSPASLELTIASLALTF